MANCESDDEVQIVLEVEKSKTSIEIRRKGRNDYLRVHQQRMMEAEEKAKIKETEPVFISATNQKVEPEKRKPDHVAEEIRKEREDRARLEARLDMESLDLQAASGRVAADKPFYYERYLSDLELKTERVKRKEKAKPMSEAKAKKEAEKMKEDIKNEKSQKTENVFLEAIKEINRKEYLKISKGAVEKTQGEIRNEMVDRRYEHMERVKKLKEKHRKEFVILNEEEKKEMGGRSVIIDDETFYEILCYFNVPDREAKEGTISVTGIKGWDQKVVSNCPNSPEMRAEEEIESEETEVVTSIQRDPNIPLAEEEKKESKLQKRKRKKYNRQMRKKEARIQKFLGQ